MNKKIFLIGFLFSAVILAGSSCQVPEAREMEELSEISSSQAGQILYQTAMELGWGTQQTRVSDNSFPADFFVNEFHTMRIDNKNDGTAVPLEKQYNLPGELNPATFAKEYCEMRKSRGHIANLVDVAGYPACNITFVENGIGGIYLFVGQYLVRYDSADTFINGMTNNLQVANMIVDKLLSIAS